MKRQILLSFILLLGFSSAQAKSCFTEISTLKQNDKFKAAYRLHSLTSAQRKKVGQLLSNIKGRWEGSGSGSEDSKSTIRKSV